MMRINIDRLMADLDSLGRIGSTGDGGVTRLAFSVEDVAGRRWFCDRVREAGLELRQDGAGNLSAVLSSDDPGAPTLLAGSHLDTVPHGGRFDGSLGVLAALEALRTLKERGVRLPVHLEAISFSDEEGTLLGELGSLALAGTLTEQTLGQARGGKGALEEGLGRLGLSCETVLAASRPAKSIAAYVELHIEQGCRLEQESLDLGVVRSIVGIRSARLRFKGLAGHAGTLPLAERRDALWGAAAMVSRARDRVLERFSPGVLNFGDLQVSPGAFNIVPEEALLTLEFRHESEEILDSMQQELFDLARQVAQEYRLELSLEPASRCPAAPSSEWVMRAIEGAADALELRHRRLLSFAGHDAQAIGVMAPSAMIFVPCVDGISHNPRELCHRQDIENGANAVLHTLHRLAAPSIAGGMG